MKFYQSKPVLQTILNLLRQLRLMIRKKIKVSSKFVVYISFPASIFLLKLNFNIFGFCIKLYCSGKFYTLGHLNSQSANLHDGFSNNQVISPSGKLNRNICIIYFGNIYWFSSVRCGVVYYCRAFVQPIVRFLYPFMLCNMTNPHPKYQL